MADHEKDVSMLSNTHPKLVDEEVDSRFSPFLSRNQSASISIPVNSMESYGFETNLGGCTGPLHSERNAPLVQMSGPLYINRNTENLFLANHGVTTRKKVEPTERCQSFKGMDPSDWDDMYTATNAHLMRSGQLGMCNDPYCTTCPSYYHSKDSRVNNCIVIDWPMTKTIVVFRSLTDLIYLLNMLLQFMLAYVAPESRVVGAGELVDHPKKILKHYLQGCFFIDLIVVLPLPQVSISILESPCCYPHSSCLEISAEMSEA
ncbi:probable cyclic nucleotide-gated ion channel 20, chloroplastic isoform X2 [Populus alba]|uniref:Cyclic nucleotide-gated ion channel 20 family protein n=1 Tax=Populus alba TaxID=43335 RepID=A0A4U5MPY0_POPAL|nr:probable cyclic nucleotide-gated ion channel 20, chloroplastic isoform X2 [Populus alba]TKR71063.1 cyclic nucleotide-gated ion channel 20 family protein [Populus alba]